MADFNEDKLDSGDVGALVRAIVRCNTESGARQIVVSAARLGHKAAVGVADEEPDADVFPSGLPGAMDSRKTAERRLGITTKRARHV